jgi:hypothetical protein
MATANFNDMQTLATDTVFGNRVWEAVEIYCGVVNSESISSTMPIILHTARKQLSSAIAQNQATYKPIFVNIAASNQTVANDATASGTIVGQTGATLATSALLCTDTDISNAIAAAFNSLLPND